MPVARPRISKRAVDAHPPQVKLGAVADGGLAPAILAIVERGVTRRPALAQAMKAEIQLEMSGYPEVRIVFDDSHVLVEDGPGQAPDLRIVGALSDLTSLMVTPLLGGVPSPIRPRGRAALGMVVLGRVRIQGRVGLMRRLLNIIRV